MARGSGLSGLIPLPRSPFLTPFSRTPGERKPLSAEPGARRATGPVEKDRRRTVSPMISSVASPLIEPPAPPMRIEESRISADRGYLEAPAVPETSVDDATNVSLSASSRQTAPSVMARWTAQSRPTAADRP